MGARTVLLALLSCAVIAYAARWLEQGRASGEPYDWKEDFRRTFLTLRWKYSADLHDGRPRRFTPVLLILGGLAGLVVAGLQLLRA